MTELEMSEENIELIFSKYGLGQYIGSKTFHSGSTQTNVLVDTAQGRYVLKRYGQERNRNSVLFETNLLLYLGKHKFPCPTPIKSKKDGYVGTFDNKPYVVFELNEGQHIERLGWIHRRQIIELVAKLHRVTKGYRPAYKRYRWNYDANLCLTLAQREASMANDASAKEKLNWLSDELSVLRLPKNLPKGICHCDFHPSNTLFTDNRLNALIDFDDANHTFLLYDVASLIEPFISDFRWDNWRAFDDHESVFDFGDARRVVAEYDKHRPLNNNERRHLYDVYKLSVLFDCVWHFDRGGPEEFYEKRKISHLNSLGREAFHGSMFL